MLSRFNFTIQHKRIVSVLIFIFVSQFLFAFIDSPFNSVGRNFINRPLPNDSIVKKDSIPYIVEPYGYNALISDSLVSFSKNYLGIKYHRGGRSFNSLDCSGFTSLVYEHFGYKIDRSASGQAIHGFNIEKSEVKKGDLIFFKGRNQNSSTIGHVGIAISNENGKISFIHASVNNGISYDITESTYYKTRYVCARRIINPLDTLKFVKLAIDSIKPKNQDDNKYSKDKINYSNNKTYVVKGGDNLYAISKRFNCTVENLKDWNGLTNNNINVGQKLIIQKITLTNDEIANPSSNNDKQNQGVETKEIFYEVQKGDNLWAISRKYNNVSVEDIRKWNGLNADSKLPIGFKLKILVK